MGDILDCEQNFEVKILKDAIAEKDKEITRLRILLKEADIEDGVEFTITDEEVICIQEISKLRKKSDNEGLDLEDVKKFEILHKNLKIARGEGNRVGRQSNLKNMDAKQLEDMLKGI